MNFMIRPSKTFLFDQLEKELKKSRGKIGLDAGSADMKNRWMFKTEKYFGMDIDLESLHRGMSRYRNDRGTFAIHADLRNLNKFSTDSVDVVVSTNTVHNWFDHEMRIEILNHLSRITSSQGRFICELYLDNDFDKYVEVLKFHFKNVKVMYYKNPFSRAYELIFEINTHLGSHPIAGKKPMRLMAWFISRLEFLTCKFSSINRHGFIVCSEKIRKGERKEFISYHFLKHNKMITIKKFL